MSGMNRTSRMASLRSKADVRYDPHPGHTDKELSQTMSNILRHAAHAFRIVLQPDGFANLSDVLNACNRTIDEGLNVARTSRKYGQARQELRDDPRQGLMIRATQHCAHIPRLRGTFGSRLAETCSPGLHWLQSVGGVSSANWRPRPTSAGPRLA